MVLSSLEKFKISFHALVMHDFGVKSYIDVHISFNFGIDIDPILLICINWSKVNVQNIVFATFAIIARIAVIARWVNLKMNLKMKFSLSQFFIIFFYLGSLATLTMVVILVNVVISGTLVISVILEF